MNKRQKKKAFKKKYGFNPINTKATIEVDWADTVSEAFVLGERMKETLKYIASEIIPLMAENIKNILNETSKAISELINKVKNMSDEEWEEFKKVLDGDQIALLEHMRKEWNKQYE